MPSIRITQFAGLVPEITERNIPATSAQVAHNCLLTDGTLRPQAKWVKLEERTLDERAIRSIAYDKVSGKAIMYASYDAITMDGVPFVGGSTIGAAISPPVVVHITGDTLVYRGAGIAASGVTGGVSYTRTYMSNKPVNRVYAVSRVRKLLNRTEEGPLAALIGSPDEVVYEGDNAALTITVSALTDNATHIRLYRSITGLDTGQEISNSLDTGWFLIDELAIPASGVVLYNDSGSVTTDPLDAYYAGQFHTPVLAAQYLGLVESGSFVAGSATGDIAVSERFLHHAWPVEFRYKLHETITDMVVSMDNVYVGTKGVPYIGAVQQGEKGIQAAFTPFGEMYPCLPNTMTPTPSGAMYASHIGLVGLSREGQRVLTANLTNAGNTLYSKTVGTTKHRVAVDNTEFGTYHNGWYYAFTKPIQPYASTPPDPEPVDPLTYMVWQLAEFSGSVSGRHVRTAYATFDEATKEFITLATIDHAPAHGSTGTAGFMMDGDLIVKVWTDQTSAIPEQVSGVYALRYDGTATLQQLDHWRMSELQYDMYSDIVRYSDNEIAVVHADPSGDATIRMLEYADGVLSPVGDPLVIQSPTQYEYVATMHNGYVVVLCHALVGVVRFLKAFAWDGSEWTLAATYGGSITGSMDPGSGMLKSFGGHLYTPGGQIFTFDGSTFTLVTTATVVGLGKKIAAFTGHFVVLQGTTPIKVHSFDGTTAVEVDSVAATVWGWATYGGAWASPAGVYLLPSDTVENIDKSGIFEWNGTDLVRLGPLQFDNDDRVRTPVITIDKLHAKLVEP